MCYEPLRPVAAPAGAIMSDLEGLDSDNEHATRDDGGPHAH